MPSSVKILDPTKNVLDLVKAAIERQDDLRDAESRHLREIAALRAEFNSELRVAEAERINAIREVDVQAVQRAAEVQATQQLALANQVAATADAFRISMAAALEPIIKDIADLRRSQYELAGQRSQVVESGTSNRAWIALAIAGAVGLSGTFIGVVGIAITLILRSQ